MDDGDSQAAFLAICLLKRKTIEQIGTSLKVEIIPADDRNRVPLGPEV